MYKPLGVWPRLPLLLKLSWKECERRDDAIKSDDWSIHKSLINFNFCENFYFELSVDFYKLTFKPCLLFYWERLSVW